MKNSLFIQLIADYGTGDAAFAEVVQKLTLLDSQIRVMTTSVPPFSTLATGFLTAQFALVNPVPGMMIYTNTAPRKDKKENRHDNEGEFLSYALLNNGVKVVGVNAGYCFSFIKPVIKDLHLVNVQNKGSQFRSRDFYPEAVISIAQGNAAFIGKKIEQGKLPDVPLNRIAYIDGYGNMKTTSTNNTATLTPGQKVQVTINGIERTAYYSNGTFGVKEGEVAYAPGSSGVDAHFMELFMRGGSAWDYFGKPHIESQFSIVPVT